VIIRMRRRHSGERVEQYRRRIHALDGQCIRDTVIGWATSAEVKWPELPHHIQDRDADVWEPLIAVADAVGGSWPARARRAAVALVAESKDAEISLGVKLLSDLRLVFEDAQELPSETILTRLIKLPESLWADIRGKPLDQRGLAKRLRQYEIKPKTIRTGPDSTPRGYCRADFEDQWRRLLPPSSDKSATSTTPETPPSVAAVADVLDFSAKGGDSGICQHCGTPGQLIDCYVEGEAVRLHRDCTDGWMAANPTGGR
jgi:hypothetical protein